MEDKKINKAEEIGKSFIVGIFPVTLIRLIFQLNFHITNASINSIVMIGLVGLIYFLRIKTKWSRNNDLPILFLTIIFLPAGLYYLWKYSNRTNTTKTISTSIIAGFLIFMIILANI